MNLGNNHKELIGKYLSGKMDQRERAAFETDMETDSQLQQEVKYMARLYVGLTSVEKADSGHIDIDLLVKYQENPSELEDDVGAGIESHIRSCSECAEEARLCSLVPVADPEPRTELHDSILVRIRKFFFVPRLRIQPAVGLITLIILAIPIIYSIQEYYTPKIETAHYQLEPGTREIEQKNIILVGGDRQIISLEFGPAVIDDCPSCLYDFELYDPYGVLRVVSKNNKYQKIFAFELIDNYFSSKGYYTLRIIETTEDGNREIIDVYQILIRFSQ